MKISSIVAAFAFAVASVSGANTTTTTGNNKASPLILGGSVVPANTKTWITGLRVGTNAGSNTICGGTLITNKHILTAGHCVHDNTFTYAAVGTHYYSGTSDGQRIAVAKTTIHPSYNAQTLQYDFAIVELKTAVASPITPIKLRLTRPTAGTTATVAGWGATTTADFSNELMQVDVPISTDSDCSRVDGVDIKTMMCAGGVVNKDSCFGDSGGPLTIKRISTDVLVGLVSGGSTTCGTDIPSVYAPVSLVGAWINSTVAGSTITWVS